MIISVRGTSGSGKTHLTRRLLAKMTLTRDITLEKIRPPVAEVYTSSGAPQLTVAGHYRVPSGGADRVSMIDREALFALFARLATEEPGNFLYEGLMVSNEVTRTAVMARTHQTLVIFLNTPLADCMASIRERRAARGVMEPVSEKNTTEKFEALRRVRFRLRDAGVEAPLLDREEAYALCCQRLGLTP